MKNILIMFIIFLISCEDNNPILDENLNVEYLKGLWLVTNSYPTNGPICIFIEKNDTVRFDFLSNNENALIMYYKSEGNYFKDLYNFNIQNNTLKAIGYYKASILNENGKYIDTLLPQKLFIELSKNEIKCSIEHGIYDNDLDSLIFGEVSNFTAVKIKGTD